ncbi:unnamed protein product [Toxocara canis]|uniref:CACTA en-spm transposon protein n=1 Tax=Toxocara canis TaxID=6265 RepID=A0A183UD82_TOXCA|nr:unnamed protein product [Toxocara canis]
MNFLAKHFFEYQSFINLPHKAVQLHKTPPSQAGSDPSASWAPKSMNKAGKNQAAPGARANRNNTDTRPAAHRHGRAGKHEYREWGDRHGELKPEKIVPHKDAWTKFLSNEEAAGKRTLFECDFEDRILQTEPETLPERLSRTEKNGDVDFSIAHPGTSNPVSKEYNPFARVMLFEGRRLLEQKQTTITPTVTCNGCVSTGSRPKPACSNSSTSSSSVSSGSAKSNDAIFSESFLFHVSPQMLDRCHIVIEVFIPLIHSLIENAMNDGVELLLQMYDSNPEDPDKGPFPIGHCVVGPMCAGTGCAHWFQMIRKNSLPVCMWHRMTKN